MNSTIEKVMDNLRKNNLNPIFAPTKADVVPLLETLLPDGASVAVGGSVTLNETGALDLLRCGRYDFLDRYAIGLTAAQKEEIYRKSFFADAYLSSSNAVTEQGELYNVDGTGNRVAAIAYGPKKVIFVVGINKIVADLNEAVQRVKTCAAPPNAKRLGFETYCMKAGHCMRVDGAMTEGCSAEKRICCSYLVTGYQRIKDRVHVILVGEDCGY
jgi:L-lactate utilization protein LutB